jgi:hypothetical protein
MVAELTNVPLSEMKKALIGPNMEVRLWIWVDNVVTHDSLTNRLLVQVYRDFRFRWIRYTSCLPNNSKPRPAALIQIPRVSYHTIWPKGQNDSITLSHKQIQNVLVVVKVVD